MEENIMKYDSRHEKEEKHHMAKGCDMIVSLYQLPELQKTR